VTGIRIGVIGTGHMGGHHARKIASLASAEPGLWLAGVSDIDRERADALAAELGCRAVVDFRELLPELDAAVVAVPTVRHFEIVSTLLTAGVDVLVEKPIAATLEEGERLLALAREHGRVLQVGHLEWFNAAMRTVKSRITRPRFIEAHRMGPFSARATDVDVVRDLMIHDLDILQRLVDEEPERVESIGVPVITDKVDIANARATFPGGCVANLTVSRVSPTPLRKIRFFQPDGYFSIDFLEQAVVIARRVRAEDGEKKVEIENLSIDREDALVSQLRAFLDAVASREVPDGAGDQALAALRTALRVIDAMPPLELPDDDDLPLGG